MLVVALAYIGGIIVYEHLFFACLTSFMVFEMLAVAATTIVKQETFATQETWSSGALSS